MVVYIVSPFVKRIMLPKNRKKFFKMGRNAKKVVGGGHKKWAYEMFEREKVAFLKKSKKRSHTNIMISTF